MLSDRRQRVLAALIEEYVARALPVGSRTLAEQYGFDVSPATIRNDLSALEDEGYITQPHTSAGRVPTDFGYRAFVDHLVESGIVGEGTSEAAVSQLMDKAQKLDDLLEQTSSALAQFTECLSIVAPPGVAHPTRLGLSSLMRQPEFAHTRALLPIMQVLEDDTVLLHVLDASAPLGSSEASVRIGGENAAEQLSGVSLVACRYGSGDSEGIVAVIGPTRMDYSKVLGAVRMASRMLGED